jgi:hypothetical protein
MPTLKSSKNKVWKGRKVTLASYRPLERSTALVSFESSAILA